MSDQDRRPEDVVLTGATGIDPAGRVAETYRANANLSEGLMLVSYTNEYGNESAIITLDRDRDGTPDATFQSNEQGGTYFTSGDKPELHFTAADAATLTQRVHNIITNGGTDVALYREVAAFAIDPVHNSLPNVTQPRKQNR